MSILLDVPRPDGLPDMVAFAARGVRRPRLVRSNVIKCDHCGAEVVLHRSQQIEIPPGWLELNGNHRCPGCRTQRAVARDRKAYLAAQRGEARRLLAERGISDPHYVGMAMRMLGG